jgi:hypothetical protein
MAAPEQSKFGALGTVLAKDLSTIEDLPDYIAPPPGVYKLLILSCGQKTINEKTAIVVDYLVVECKALSDAEADKAEAATIKYGKDHMSEAFYFDKAERIDTVLGVLKKKYGGLGVALGTTNLLEILDKMANLSIEAQCGRRVDDNDKTKFYGYTRNIVAAV